ncbi:MAG: 16S rRNA (cytosine(1402)-N(4))-methyltransferase RsmH [Lachnospiraceae bacterium]|nr:16S rRNA (cytosine(1402)-N(4))-methyltransferase RsmH [Lachnospiraceae bacterium]
MEFDHRSVMLEEIIEGLEIKPEGTYVDGTLGGGGHSYEILKRLKGQGSLIGIDQDEAAIEAASERLKGFENKIIVRDNYKNIRDVVLGNHKGNVDGIILDLGVSSYQLDTPERGFSYNKEAPLDMRMDQRSEKTARDIVNGYGYDELVGMIRDYGEEPFAKNIARHIVNAREKAPIETTTELAALIREAIPAKARSRKGHPAKQTFQAIRIELNEELDVLRDTIETMIDLLNEDGRLCIITFHSLEDRIVKTAFRKAEDPCICPKRFPVCVCGRKPKGIVITKKPIVPSEKECEDNPRSKSAKLRIFERGRNIDSRQN